MITKSLVLIFIVFISCIIIFISPLKYKHGLSLIINKYSILTNSHSPKIVLIGGSSLLNGVDSSYIKKRLGYDVVNMGHYAGFGISVILNSVQDYISTDDIVVITPEYRMLIDNDKFDPFNDVGLKWMLAYSPMRTILDIYSKRHFNRLGNHFAELISEKTQTLIEYTLKGKLESCIGHGKVNAQDDINEFGDTKKDVFSKLPFNKFPDNDHVFQSNISDESKFTLLNNFNKIVKYKKAKVFFIFPPYPKEAYELNKTQFAEIHKQLEEKLNFKVLGIPEDFIYSSEYFSNTCNHLTAQGKYLRTHKFIELLNKKNN